MAIAIIAVAVLAICVFVLPAGIRTTNVWGYKPIIYGMYVAAVPFYVGLYQAIKLLNLIDQNKAFSKISVSILQIIKLCAFTISALYALGMPYIFYVADKDNAPGVVLIGCVIVGASFIIAVATAVFQSLTQNAVDLKSENDLTV